MLSLFPYNRRGTSPFHYWNTMDRSLASATPRTTAFRCDITEKDGIYLLEAELPGFEKDDISVQLDGETLTIAAKHKTETEETNQEGTYIRRERRFGSFERSFDVTGIDTEAIAAEYKNGILHLNLPKAKEVESPSARSIAIAG